MHNEVEGGKEMNRNESLSEEMTNNEKSTSEQIYKMIQNSSENEAVIWDGINVGTVEKDVVGGEDGGYLDFSRVSHYIADNLIMFDYPSTFKQVDVDETHPDSCHFIKDDAEFFVSRVDYLEDSSEFDKDENYIEIDLKGLKEGTTKYYKNYKTYFGTKDIDGKKKAGYVLILENKSELARRDYRIEVYGLGELDYVTILALTVMNGFSVIWYPLKGN